MNAIERKSKKNVHWAGVDVAKLSFDAALFRHDLRDEPFEQVVRSLPTRRFARTKAGARDFVAWLDSQLGPGADAVRVCMEATGKHAMELSVWLLEIRVDLGPAVVNAKKVKAFAKSLELRNCTDKLQARAISRFGIDRAPAPYQPPDPAIAKLRDMSRYREALVEQRTAEKNRAGEGSESTYVRAMQKRRLKKLGEDIKKLEETIETHIAETPSLAKAASQLSQIHGVGPVTATVVLAELGDLRRFERARQLTAFAGLSPRNVESGTSVRWTPRMCKQGNSRVRHTLYMAAMAAIRKPNDLQATYKRLIANHKAPMAALGAVMRKLLCVMRALLISEEPYRPFAKGCG